MGDIERAHRGTAPSGLPLANAVVPLVADLARDLPPDERYRRLLAGLQTLMPCDAAALLRLEGEALVPLAVVGLSADVLGRRFRVAEHPRFDALLRAGGPLRFDADSPLPDPYDGLVDGVHGALPVHDCLGCVLQVQERPWGLLTLDALDAHRFDGVAPAALQAFAGLAAATVAVAARLERLAGEADEAQRRAEGYRLAGAGTAPRRLLGQSPALRALLDEIGLVGGSELPVLIQGETGVGKELVAQALHAASSRAAQPMVSLNCAALPDALVESELFGHVRGAFTGAVGERRGKFELAHGGTLFLDEVGELPLGVQAKLLRVLQSGQLQRLGSDREHRVDVRLIAASNRRLAEEVRAGRMRADFYHRLSVYPLHVPPLRERGRDVLLLAGGFAEENRARLGLRAVRLGTDAQGALLAHDWPGNVRELEHLIGRAVLRALARSPGPRRRMLELRAADLDLSSAHPGRGTAPRASVDAALSAAPAEATRRPLSDGASAEDDDPRQRPSAAQAIAQPSVWNPGGGPEPAERAELGLARALSESPFAVGSPATPTLREAVDALQRDLLVRALREHPASIAAAGRALGLDRANLVRLARRLDVPLPSRGR